MSDIRDIDKFYFNLFNKAKEIKGTVVILKRRKGIKFAISKNIKKQKQ